MAQKMTLTAKALSAGGAQMGSLSRVSCHVAIESGLCGKYCSTFLAFEWSSAIVETLMGSHDRISLECFGAEAALIWSLSRMDSLVLAKCGGIRKRFTTLLTHKRLLSRMRTHVREQSLHGAENFATAGVGAGLCFIGPMTTNMSIKHILF